MSDFNSYKEKDSFLIQNVMVNLPMKLKNAFKNNMCEYQFFIAVFAVIPELT